MMMQPLLFGAPERTLFGLFHPASANRPGVLLCAPFGQEAIRTQRFYRVLTERLVRAGHPVLRFDYYGCGDSMGDDTDGDLEGWILDVLTADAELRRLAGCKDCVWMGMRLGAALALMAAARAAPAPARVVAWDAVLNGSQYLALLRDRHVTSLIGAFSLVPSPNPARLAEDPAQYCDQAIGYALSPSLREQLAALRLTGSGWPSREVESVMVGDPDDPDMREWAAAPPAKARFLALQHGIDWTSNSAGSLPLVPAPALMALTQQLGAAL
jgi:pimeloyl-ACP methyl ester carboxylesterase